MATFPRTEEFSREALSGWLTPKDGLHPSSSHPAYLAEYLARLEAKTIVIEEEYRDRDYIEDFAAYYVRCFAAYPVTCTRLHFFTLSLTDDDLRRRLTETIPESDDELRQAYLGFIVIKPLPRTIIGRTCLKTYPIDEQRHYPITRRYDVNLCGLELTVETLAFQEQDQVVAVCASTALWCVFQGTGVLFHHHIPSPAQITESATRLIPPETRTLPSDGLSPAQIAHAIRAVRLEPELTSVLGSHDSAGMDAYILRASIYAYLKMGVPLLLGIDLFDISNSNTPKYLDAHAVAVTGFHLQSEAAPPVPDGRFCLRANRIDRFYVHDDHVGPFARMVFDGKKIKHARFGHTPVGAREAIALTTSWLLEDGRPGQIRAVPTSLVLPLYHKIRVRFATIHNVVRAFDDLLKKLCDQRAGLVPPLEWDVALCRVQSWKQEVRSDTSLSVAKRELLLASSLPRFLWRAVAYRAGSETRVVELHFDATDLEQGNFFLRAILHDQEYAETLRLIGDNPVLLQEYVARPVVQILRGLVAAG